MTSCCFVHFFLNEYKFSLDGNEGMEGTGQTQCLHSQALITNYQFIIQWMDNNIPFFH